MQRATECTGSSGCPSPAEAQSAQARPLRGKSPAVTPRCGSRAGTPPSSRESTSVSAAHALRYPHFCAHSGPSPTGAVCHTNCSLEKDSCPKHRSPEGSNGLHVVLAFLAHPTAVPLGEGDSWRRGCSWGHRGR